MIFGEDASFLDVAFGLLAADVELFEMFSGHFAFFCLYLVAVALKAGHFSFASVVEAREFRIFGLRIFWIFGCVRVGMRDVLMLLSFHDGFHGFEAALSSLAELSGHYLALNLAVIFLISCF